MENQIEFGRENVLYPATLFAVYQELKRQQLNAYHREWKHNNKDKVAKWQQEYREKYPEKEKEHQRLSNAKKSLKYYTDLDFQKKRKEESRFRHFKHKYNLTEDQIEEQFRLQEGKCKICIKPLTLYVYNNSDGAKIDHNHRTGKFRGLLCHNCNTTVGYIETHLDYIDIILNYIGK
jgi:Recombination endonuclease VII